MAFKTVIEKTYEPRSIEQKWYQTWEHAGYFTPSGQGESYCIMLPPPNVTGSLHMGHGFGFTLMDVLIRYQRMCGKNTLWQMGTDHAGISTQMVVERNLNLEGKTRHTLGREKFVERVWAWKNESSGNITRQLRRLGASLDWSCERFTLDPDISYAVREVFVQLFEEGFIYRGERLVNWDPQLLTAISDLEVVYEETEGKLWHIRYLLENSNDQLIVATTRPETLFGDVALAVHPEDARYCHLIGKNVNLPLTTRKIPIIADNYVDPLFGTGCVKITPAHDFNDFAVGVRHGLSPLNIFTPNAHMNENVPLSYQGLERFAARKQVLEDLESRHLLEKIEKHHLTIPRGEKSGAIIEPYLTKQWFMKMKSLSQPAIKAVESGEIRFIPENWRKTYYQWMENIEDWCISRQLWWGHRIPVWYDKAGNQFVGHDEETIKKKYSLSPTAILTQDEDVLDTWFSAALWPFTTLGWPKNTNKFNIFYPTQVLMTGFDIIFFWVARMIMMGLKFTGKIPFHEVYITGLIRDADGHKMSKSKGNVLDPIDLIDGITLPDLLKKRTYGLMQTSMQQKVEKATRKEFPLGIPSFGTDALRFTFCSLASPTREIRFDTQRLTGYRNFCNKLWNAARYVLMNTENQDIDINKKYIHFRTADRWIISALHKTVIKAKSELSQYRFDLFAQTLYDFTWNDFCDWYLELSKPVLNASESNQSKLFATRYTLVFVFEALLRLLHPVIPFITEEIWQRIAPLAGKKSTDSIMIATYPMADMQWFDDPDNQKAMTEIKWLQNIISAIRTLRSETNISPAKFLPILLRNGNQEDKRNVTIHQILLTTLAKISSIEWLSQDSKPPASISIFLGELEIYFPMSGFINKEEEIIRLTKEITKLQKEKMQIENKLNNPQFIEKAPASVVLKEQCKLKEFQSTIIKLEEQIKEMKRL